MSVDFSALDIAVVEKALAAYPRSVTEAGCIVWLGPKRPSGYGLTRVDGRTVSVHRVSYFLANGSIPRLDICHKCDNPSCFNPDHLFAGTRSENMLDASNKKRLRCQIDPTVMPVGVKHPRCVLSESQIEEILFSSETSYTLAKKFSYSSANIGRIRKGLAWVETANRIRAMRSDGEHK